MNHVDTYHVKVAFLKPPDHINPTVREESHTECFLADDDAEGIRMAVAWAGHMKGVFVRMHGRTAHVGAVSVCKYRIGRVDLETGRAENHYGLNIFEWKCDFPGTLDQYVESKISEWEKK